MTDCEPNDFIGQLQKLLSATAGFHQLMNKKPATSEPSSNPEEVRGVLAKLEVVEKKLDGLPNDKCVKDSMEKIAGDVEAIKKKQEEDRISEMLATLAAEVEGIKKRLDSQDEVNKEILRELRRIRKEVAGIKKKDDQAAEEAPKAAKKEAKIVEKRAEKSIVDELIGTWKLEERDGQKLTLGSNIKLDRVGDQLIQYDVDSSGMCYKRYSIPIPKDVQLDFLPSQQLDNEGNVCFDVEMWTDNGQLNMKCSNHRVVYEVESVYSRVV